MSSIVKLPTLRTQNAIIMKIVVLLLAALVLCHAASVKERLATGQTCLDSVRGNGVCDSQCDFAEYKYDNGDCCKKRGFKYNGLSCVAKTNGYY